jgi:hypothetical protein
VGAAVLFWNFSADASDLDTYIHTNGISYVYGLPPNMADDISRKTYLDLRIDTAKSTEILVCARQEPLVEMRFKHAHGSEDRMNDYVVGLRPFAVTIRKN